MSLKLTFLWMSYKYLLHVERCRQTRDNFQDMRQFSSYTTHNSNCLFTHRHTKKNALWPSFIAILISILHRTAIIADKRKPTVCSDRHARSYKYIAFPEFLKRFQSLKLLHVRISLTSIPKQETRKSIPKHQKETGARDRKTMNMKHDQANCLLQHWAANACWHVCGRSHCPCRAVEWTLGVKLELERSLDATGARQANNLVSESTGGTALGLTAKDLIYLMLKKMINHDKWWKLQKWIVWELLRSTVSGQRARLKASTTAETLFTPNLRLEWALHCN